MLSFSTPPGWVWMGRGRHLADSGVFVFVFVFLFLSCQPLPSMDVFGPVLSVKVFLIIPSAVVPLTLGRSVLMQISASS